MKTYSAKPTEVTRKWYIIDVQDQTLGRISTEIAQILLGKKKPMFTHHIDCGDYVVVINAEKLKVTGKKLDDKKYYRHSGYPGGIKETALKDRMESDASAVLVSSVRGMLPVNKLRDGRLARLKVYDSQEHGHAAQNPEPYKPGGKS